MKKVGVLVIHGIGTSRRDFDAPFKKKLYKRLKKLGRDTKSIAYQKVFWARYVNKRQNQYFKACQKDPHQKLNWNWLRKFVIDNLSDASSYQRKKGQSNKNYFNIIKKINRAVRLIHKDLDAEDKPLIVLAHSLGGFIINNYIWDAHKVHSGQSVDWPNNVVLKGDFEKMINVTGIVTFGCNIPLFVIGNDPLEAIRFPHPSLKENLKAVAQWHNYYDPDDVLGWPLKELQYSFDGLKKPQGAYAYSDAVTKDIPLHVGKLLGKSPFSHFAYWTDPKFIEPVAKYISGFLPRK